MCGDALDLRVLLARATCAGMNLVGLCGDECDRILSAPERVYAKRRRQMGKFRSHCKGAQDT